MLQAPRFIAVTSRRVTVAAPRARAYTPVPRRELAGLIALALLVGCDTQINTPASSRASPELAAPPDVSSSAPEPSPPPSAPVEREPPTPATTPPPVTSAPPLERGAPTPGFVIYTREQSVVVGLDGAPPLIAEGLWVQDDRADPPPISHALVLSEARVTALGLAGCPCMALADSCARDSVQLRRLDPETGALQRERSARDCACVHRPDDWGFPPMVDKDGEKWEACEAGSDEGIASLVAGTLALNGWDWNGACYGGLSVYDAMDSGYALVESPPSLSSEGMRVVACHDMGPAFVEPPWPIGQGAYEPIDDCELGDGYESEIFMIRRGYLWAVRDDIGFAHGTRESWRRPARPGSCPSVNDACGDPAPFRKRARLGRQTREFWIATDGGMALTAMGRAYALWSAGDEPELVREFTLPAADATHEVIGVRVHADVSRLRALIQRHPGLGAEDGVTAPATVEPARCLELHADGARVEQAPRSARAWGDDCFARMGIGHWYSAEGSCLQGLQVASEDKTRGALLYNLGRLAEAQGADVQAMTHYRASLTARPGNRTVARRLARIERKTQRASAE